MPSHTPASALVKLFFAEPGAPWVFPRWLEITQLKHPFNSIRDECLPRDLTRAELSDIESYFSQYNAKATEVEKIKFAMKKKEEGTDTVPGREIWRNWVTKHYSPHWKVHTIIAKILSSQGIHPVQIMEATGETSPPNNASYLPIVLDAIGRELFGPEALDPNKRVRIRLREPTLILAQRTWQLEVRSIEPRKRRVEKLFQQAIEKLSNLEAGNVTVKGINQAIRAVANFENACCSGEQFDALHRLKADLEPFIPDEGVKSKSGAKRVAKPPTKRKVTKEKLAQSATPEEVTRLLEMYDQYFGHPSTVEEELDAEEPQGVAFGQPEEGADPGVEVEAKMTISQLASRLGLGTGVMPFLFNTVRHSGGLTAWTKEFEDACRLKDKILEKFSLQWHQLCGVHAALRMILTPTPQPNHCTGVLFADDVGLGKTIQTSAIMAILSDVCVLQQRKLALPPVARELPFLGESNKIPSLPHLVIVPGTLLRQWEHELQCFFKNRSVEILMYESGISDHEEFWKPEGIYHQSNLPASHRIILAAQSALQQDFNQLYTNQRGSMALPWDLPERAPGYAARLPFTIFNQKYLTVVIDEAQGLRNLGAKHSAALRILDQGSVRLILTATPLQTSTKDIAAMGRLMGIPYFTSEEARDDQTADNADLRRAKIEREAEPESFTPDDDPVKIAQVEISKRLAAQFQNRVIRRVATSLDVDGKPLIELPPINVIEGVVHLTERERKILEEITLEGLAEASDANSRNISSQTFYIEHRMGVTFPREDPSDPIPVFKTIDEWKEQLGTKIHVLVQVSRYILTRDDMPPVRFENGALIFSRPPMTNVRFTREVKIVIYQEFPSYTSLVINIFRLYGIEVLSICGRDSFEQRAKVVKKFNEDPKYRVLIFSKVGSTGLNLTRASFIIFLDQPWSAQDERQIIGRVWRQLQRRVVTAIHLLASDTADITLSSLAQGKKSMLDAFLTTDTSKALFNTMTGDVLRDDDEEDEEEVVPKKRKMKKSSCSSAQGRGKSKRKSAPTISDDEDVDDDQNAAGSKASSSGPKPSAESDGTTDTDAYGLSTDTSMHEISLSLRAVIATETSLEDGNSSSSSLMGLLSYESSDEEMEGELPGVFLTNQADEGREGEHLARSVTEVMHVLIGFILSDEQMNDSSLVGSFSDQMNIEPSSLAPTAVATGTPFAKKRARAPSSPPRPGRSADADRSIWVPPSPPRKKHESVIKKARLQASLRPNSSLGYSTSHHTKAHNDEDRASPLMTRPLLPPLSSMGVFDSPPIPMTPPSPSPSRHPADMIPPRKTSFLAMKSTQRSTMDPRDLPPEKRASGSENQGILNPFHRKPPAPGSQQVSNSLASSSWGRPRDERASGEPRPVFHLPAASSSSSRPQDGRAFEGGTRGIEDHSLQKLD
ncbi:hypothetical protein EST38_g13407 [Candolleomyces aberdarensis]|uniref:Helicase n=1 Tax=Candolleomyces aberdarensis TaxID=2316362 RepID=A0A4Q2D015_9AGAR|nr:hypothetical protein EST38_g13407 [Candolleomyces aberdarensis]